mmetsp:Transcript_18294/g.69322  ORF Transcript_18294/g.69322 Transcript_18294/m.69322 type:complete len:80 (-) Transcript_18294:60-299(-)
MAQRLIRREVPSDVTRRRCALLLLRSFVSKRSSNHAACLLYSVRWWLRIRAVEQLVQTSQAFNLLGGKNTDRSVDTLMQ